MSRGNTIPTVNASFITLDGTSWDQNSSSLVFRPLTGSRGTTGGVFFTLGTPQGTQSTIVISKFSSNGSLLAQGFLNDSVINPCSCSGGGGAYVMDGGFPDTNYTPPAAGFDCGGVS